MLRFFDYLYYGARKFYNKERGSGVSALVLIALTQALNIFTVYFLYCVISGTKVYGNKLIFIAPYFFFLVLNVIRYSKLDPEIIKEKWENKKEKQKIRMRALLVIYVFLSFALSIELAIFIGNRENS